ncbi:MULTISPECIES: ABC transporter ATP-binding protein [Clostridia]|uniref:ABC transporter ATP-binding protein n=1 Tax=Clostridia TaxID=186801 RepID=UPI000EA25B5E|nr:MULTISPECIES: ABC transporter ATP-binding protein [Clostridia]NBJ68005.1 ABC transporter ATP-binding protein [Roseburia sp. 1XD42-34]RKI82448.1 ABC transporter ATP-binding protein [Clostridium sp. 1xD42-85]
MLEVILELQDLHTHFYTDKGEIPAVDGVSLSVHKGEVVGIVGESGCGKSVTSLSVMQLIPSPPGKIVSGNIKFKGEEIVSASNKRMKQIRGNEISMIFQEPMTSLDPLFTIGNQIMEGIQLHEKISKQDARNRTMALLRLVGIPRANEIVDSYPHQLSGGMRQRVMIAMSMACNPDLLIADEPTTALDVTIQAQILDLMRQLNKEKQTAILLITHDLGIVAEICDRVVVMYAGQVIEEGTTREILKYPNHPYTKGLIRSLPTMNKKEQRLYSIPGIVPKPKMGRVGCRFAPRCDLAFERCFQETPPLFELGRIRKSRCFLNEQTEGGRAENDKTTAGS